MQPNSRLYVRWRKAFWTHKQQQEDTKDIHMTSKAVKYPHGGINDTPAINNAEGECINCGRDNRGHEGEPCIDDCPMYWEQRGFTHPDGAEDL